MQKVTKRSLKWMTSITEIRREKKRLIITTYFLLFLYSLQFEFGCKLWWIVYFQTGCVEIHMLKFPPPIFYIYCTEFGGEELIPTCNTSTTITFFCFYLIKKLALPSVHFFNTKLVTTEKLLFSKILSTSCAYHFKAIKLDFLLSNLPT